jgi:cbb3-type cytochrome oxidase cytochrome c subunit
MKPLFMSLGFAALGLLQIAAAPEALKGKTELDAIVAYLQGLGTDLRNVR